MLLNDFGWSTDDRTVGGHIFYHNTTCSNRRPSTYPAFLDYVGTRSYICTGLKYDVSRNMNSGRQGNEILKNCIMPDGAIKINLDVIAYFDLIR